LGCAIRDVELKIATILQDESLVSHEHELEKNEIFVGFEVTDFVRHVMELLEVDEVLVT
jgi:hypothetical protein